jgi:hypothetical protein
MYTKGITISNSRKINTVRFAEDQVKRADPADNLQLEIFTLQNKAKNFVMEIPPEKSKTMGLLVQGPVRGKIFVNNKCLQQVNFQIHLKLFYKN